MRWRRLGILAVGVAACTPAASAATAAAADGTVAGVVKHAPASGRGVADVRAIRLDTGIVAAARRAGKGGRFRLRLGAGPYLLVMTVVDRRAARTTTRTSTPVTVRAGSGLNLSIASAAGDDARVAYVQRSGAITPTVRALEVHDFTGAGGRLRYLNRGLSELLQTQVAAAGGGCETALVAGADDRRAIASPHRRSARFDGAHVNRDLVVPDIAVRGKLSGRSGSLRYTITTSDARSGATLDTLGGRLAVDRQMFARAQSIGKALLRRICGPATITLTNPASGGALGDSAPWFVGIASTAAAASATVTVRIFAGTTAAGLPLQSPSAKRGTGGAYSARAAPLAPGTYTARAEQSGAGGAKLLSSANTFVVDPAAGDPTLIGAGDIAGCGRTEGGSATAAIIAAFPAATVFTLGDNAYASGQPDQFANCYGPTWGTFKARTRPVTGDHDSASVAGGTPPNQAFVDYFHDQLAPFGPTATDRLKAYYSYDIGAWHIAALNSDCYRDLPGCSTEQQEQWLSDDLAAHPNACTAVMWHETRWSSGTVHGPTRHVQPLWQIAYDGGADIALAGHEHNYERFAPQDDKGKLDTTYGVRAFVAGTGGYFLYQFGTAAKNSEARGSVYGVLKLNLHGTSYDWQFIPAAGQTFTDSGTGSCHGTPPKPGNG